MISAIAGPHNSADADPHNSNEGAGGADSREDDGKPAGPTFSFETEMQPKEKKSYHYDMFGEGNRLSDLNDGAPDDVI